MASLVTGSQLLRGKKLSSRDYNFPKNSQFYFSSALFLLSLYKNRLLDVREDKYGDGVIRNDLYKTSYMFSPTHTAHTA